MGGGDAGLLVLDKTAPDEGNGRLDPQQVGFMPLRDEIDNPLPSRSPWGYAVGPMPAYGTTTLNPAAVRDADPNLLLWLHLHIPGLRVGSMETEGVHTVTLSRPGAHAQAQTEPASPGRWPVTHVQGAHAEPVTRRLAQQLPGADSSKALADCGTPPSTPTSSTSGLTIPTALTPGHCRFRRRR